ncbi:MAG: hypothetical protein HQ457_07630, partial [Betaproteobacteria bacterium]|nr:hypothetical protein [Betaproteobacteria bacterium]
MVISKSIFIAKTRPVAIWSPIDAANAKILLNGKVDVYTLGGVWTKVLEAQNAWLAQGNASNKT